MPPRFQEPYCSAGCPVEAALGLIGGLGTTSLALGVGLMAAIVAVVAFADSPRMLTRLRQQVVVVDRAIPDETMLVAHLELLLGGRVHSATIQRLDLVNDTTTVDVRYSVGAPSSDALPTTGPTIRTTSAVTR